MPKGNYKRSFRTPILVIGPSIAYIPLTMGHYALIDAEDIDLLCGNWSAKTCKNAVYAHANRNGKMITLHRFLLGYPNSFVDHKNRNGLDNRRANLRFSTPNQNHWNRKISVASKTGLKGVHKEYNKWVALINVHGKRHRLGMFSNPEDAHKAYCEAAVKLHGEFANNG